MSQTKDDVRRLNESLKDVLLQRMPSPGSYPTAIPGFNLHRRDVSNQPENCINKPILAIALLATKRTLIGTEEYSYGAGNCIVAGVDMPNMSYMVDATPENPYIGMSLDLDSQLISQLSAQLPPSSISGSIRGTAVVPTDPEVLEAFSRMIELLDKPDEVPLLAPLILREIHLLLLLGPQGNLLKAVNTHGTHSNQVYRGINLLRDYYTEPLDVDSLAKQVNMATPTFRKHFKAVTGMSPTKYHKHLRLYEAQRLMLEDHKDATTAGYEVGYENLNQFNREYKRLFGDPPQRNVSQLR